MTASSTSLDCRKPSQDGESGQAAEAAEAVCRAAQAGDQQAIASILRSLQDPLFRFCLSRLRNATLARDATQETARRVLEKLPDFRGDSRLETWALGIALNVCRELIRKEERHAHASNDFRTTSRANPRANPQTREPTAPNVHSDARLDIQAAVRQLPERQAEAVTLRYLHGLSTRETAEAMNIATGTVKATLNHAMKTLRQQLVAWQEGNPS